LRSIKAQFFLTFAVMGSVLPYLPVYFAERGLSDVQVGYVLSLGGFAVLLTPVLTGLIADLRVENRTLLAGVFIASSAMLAWLLACQDFWWILVIHGLFWLAFVPATSLQDGLTFTEYSRRQEAGLAVVPYHRIRVYGTVGFIVPSIVLYVLMSEAVGAPIGASLACGAVIGLFAVGNTAWLPRTRGAVGTSNPGAEVPELNPPVKDGRGTPTMQALRRMLQPDMALFCLAMWLVQVSAGAYYSFYPIYLTREIDLGNQWLGPISTVGVLLEVGYILAFAWLLKRFGLRWLMTIGVMAVTVRMALLAWVPTLTVAVGTQVIHGLMVLVVHVAPPVYLNHRAEPAYRNSIQALFVMLVYGTGRIAGSLLGGLISESSESGVLAVFGWAAVAAGLSAVLFAVAFKDRGEGLVDS
jgi:MFS transporter, PPP family, 3-phenylpropionic acid transporter